MRQGTVTGTRVLAVAFEVVLGEETDDSGKDTTTHACSSAAVA